MTPTTKVHCRAPGSEIPLLAALTGQEVELGRVEGGNAFVHRLAEMGLLPGTQFRIVNRATRGPFIIAIKNCRLVLGRGMVGRLFVHPVQSL